MALPQIDYGKFLWKALNLGIASVICFVLLFFIYDVWLADRENVREGLATVKAGQEVIIKGIDDLHENLGRENRRTNALLQRMCENQAETDKELRNCFIPE
ncbi:MAG: hypothetical protein QM775_25640 [Pirellulales bacterium]